MPQDPFGPPIPTAPSIGGLPQIASDEMSEVMPFIAEMLQREAGQPQHQFSSIGKGLLGGVFNAVGGILGNDDLGGELFGQRTDNPGVLAKVMLEYAGLAQQSKEADKQREFQTTMTDILHDFQTRETESRQVHEEHLLDKQALTRAHEIRTQFDNTIELAGISQTDRIALANLQAKLEQGRLTKASNLELRRGLRIMDKTDELADNASTRELRSALRKIGVTRSWDMALVQEQGEIQKDLGKQSDEAALERTKVEATSREASAGAARGEAATKREQSNAKELIALRGELANNFDSAILYSNQHNDGQGNTLLHPDGLVNITANRIVEGWQLGTTPPPPEMIDKYAQWIDQQIMDHYEANPDSSYEDMTAAVQQGFTVLASATKSAVRAARDQRKPGEIESEGLSDTAYGYVDMALSRFDSLTRDMLPARAHNISQNVQTEQSVRQAEEMLTDAGTSFVAPMHRLGNPVRMPSMELRKFLNAKASIPVPPLNAEPQLFNRWTDKLVQAAQQAGIGSELANALSAGPHNQPSGLVR